jgi:hypothetical protein
MMAPPLAALSIYVHLPVVIVLISLIYSATRYEQWGAIFQEAGRWAVRMFVFLIGVAIILYLLAAFI